MPPLFVLADDYRTSAYGLVHPVVIDAVFTVRILGPNLDADDARSFDFWRVVAMHHAELLKGGTSSTTDLSPFPGNTVFHVQHFAFDVLQRCEVWTRRRCGDVLQSSARFPRCLCNGLAMVR